MLEVSADEANQLVEDVTSKGGNEVPKVIATEQEIFCIVAKPEKVGEGMNAYVTYKISTKDLDGNTVTAVRRYSDFDWLHDSLKYEYKHLIIPPLPEKAIFDRFSPEFVEYRRKELERFLKRTLAHPELKQSNSLRIFLTASESAMDAERSKPKADGPPAAAKPKEEKSFFATFTASITSAVTGPSVELKEIDPFFDVQKVYLANLDQQLQVLVQRSNANTKKRQELVATLTDFAHAASLAAGFEVGQDDGLASFWEKLSEILNQMSLLTDELVRGETDLFEDQIKDYIRIVQSCKDLMENRNALLLSLQTNKATLQLKSDKKGLKNTEILEAQESANDSEKKFNTLSDSAKTELETFKIKKGHDLRKAIRELVRMNINHQLRVNN